MQRDDFRTVDPFCPFICCTDWFHFSLKNIYFFLFFVFSNMTTAENKSEIIPSPVERKTEEVISHPEFIIRTPSLRIPFLKAQSIHLNLLACLEITNRILHDYSSETPREVIDTDLDLLYHCLVVNTHEFRRFYPNPRIGRFEDS